MIKLELPENNPNWQKIRDIYLGMVIDSTPFLMVDFKREPISYSKLNKDYIERSEEAKKAKEIIKNNCSSLFEYLYKDFEDDNDAHINPGNLYKLLMTFTDDDCLRKEGLLFETENPSAFREIFKYNIFAYSDRKRTSEFVELLNVPVCPYCNRQFITTVGRKGIRQNQLDHYRPKSRYPWFALSLHNLIPSCGPCNNLKGYNTDRLPLYPYKDEMGTDYMFYAHPTDAKGLIGSGNDCNDFSVEIINKGNNNIADKVKASIELFKLNSLYNTHADYIKSIFELRHIFGEPYLELIRNNFKENPDFVARFKDELPLRSLLYMRQIDQQNWGKSPLAKLTHDIDAQITEYEQISKK